MRVRFAASRPSRLAGVGRRREAAARVAAADRPVLGHVAGCRRPVLEQGDESGPLGRRDVVRREVQVTLHRRGDAGLVVAVERDPAAGLRTVAGGRGGGQPAGHPDRAESAGTREQVPAAQAAGGAHTAAAVSWDSGSPRPSTTRLSSRRAASSTVS